MKKIFSKQSMLIILAALLSCSVWAEDKVISVNPTPLGWDNQGFGFCYFNAKDVMNIRSTVLCSPGKVYDVKMSPALRSYAALYMKGQS